MLEVSCVAQAYERVQTCINSLAQASRKALTVDEVAPSKRGGPVSGEGITHPKKMAPRSGPQDLSGDVSPFAAVRKDTWLEGEAPRTGTDHEVVLSKRSGRDGER